MNLAKTTEQEFRDPIGLGSYSVVQSVVWQALTHWGRGKGVDNLQMSFSNALLYENDVDSYFL